MFTRAKVWFYRLVPVTFTQCSGILANHENDRFRYPTVDCRDA